MIRLVDGIETELTRAEMDDFLDRESKHSRGELEVSRAVFRNLSSELEALKTRIEILEIGGIRIGTICK